MLGLIGIQHFEAFQAPSDKLSPAKQVLPAWEEDPLEPS